MPICKITSTVTINGPQISIKGYPIIPDFGTTVHGVQGETWDAVAITQLRPPHFRQVDSHAIYVALSRVRTHYGLYWIGTHPTDDDYEFFRPSSEALLEDERLKHLFNTTLTAFDKLAQSIILDFAECHPTSSIFQPHVFHELEIDLYFCVISIIQMKVIYHSFKLEIYLLASLSFQLSPYYTNLSCRCEFIIQRTGYL